MVVLYKDLGKTAKKLLNDDYIHGKKKVQLKTKTSNGMTYTTTGALSGEKPAIDGDLSCKYSVSGASMTTKLLTAGTISHETVLENTGVNGLKLTVLGTLAAKNKQDLVATAEYLHPHVAAVLSANCINRPSVTSSLAVGVHGVTSAVQASYDIENKRLNALDVILNYSTTKEYEATLKVSPMEKSAQFIYSHVVSPDFSVAAEFDYKSRGETDTKTLTMGTKYEVDPETTLKTKIDSQGSISLSYAQQIRKSTTLILSSQFDVRQLENPAKKFGLSLVIE